jgi:nitrite reductase (NADH) small subunit
MIWIEVGHIADILLRGSRLVKIPVGCVAMFRTSEDEVYAVSDTCPHKTAP